LADDSHSRHAGTGHAYKALAGVFAQGFRFLATINGIAVALTLLAATGTIPTDLTPEMFRMPLAAFLGGVALCGVGLLWAFLAQASLFGQLVEGRRRRTHWVPLACALFAYGFSLLAFVVGCWFTLGLANLSYYYSEHPQSYSQSYRPRDGQNTERLVVCGTPPARASRAPVYLPL
jgi:hypothetical protein